MIVDAKNAVVGRLSSSVAKELLAGKKIIIVNAEQSIITGDHNQISNKYIEERRRGSPQHGPFFPKRPDMILRRIIRGMLPYKQAKGRNAMKRLRVFVGFPKSAEGKHITVLDNSVKEIKTKYMTVGKLARSIGWNE